MWLLLAQFEVRRRNVAAARKILGRAIGMCPKDKIFRGMHAVCQHGFARACLVCAGRGSLCLTMLTTGYPSFSQATLTWS